MSKIWDDLKSNMKDWSNAAVEKAEEISRVAVAKGEELSSVYSLMGVDGHDGNHYHFTTEEVISSLESQSEYNI